MIKILSAFYGSFNLVYRDNNIQVEGLHKIDVSDIITKSIVNDKVSIQACNDNFTDPNNGVVKKLYVKYEYNNQIKQTLLNEGDFLQIPDSKEVSFLPFMPINEDQNDIYHYNILLITSCNRIKQVLLSLSLNAQIIKKPFSVVIVDSSTPEYDSETMCRKLGSEDIYNKVKPNNYCSDVNLLYNAHQYFPNIEQFKVIHYSPRLTKQPGESTSVALGLMQASLIGDRERYKQTYCLKLTGTSILRMDVLSNLIEVLKEKDVVTWHRSNVGGNERSTRIFGCKPNVLASIVAKENWYDWCDDNSGVFEQRFANLINRELPDRVYYTKHDENTVLLEGGVDIQWGDPLKGRNKIIEFIKNNNIDTNATPYLKEFMESGIL